MEQSLQSSLSVRPFAYSPTCPPFWLIISNNATPHLRDVREEQKDTRPPFCHLPVRIHHGIHHHREHHEARNWFVIILSIRDGADKRADLNWSSAASTNPTFGLLPIQFCVPVGLPSYYAMFWIPLLAFEILLLVLALYKGYECSKTYKLDVLDRGSGRLAMLLVRDSILYFTVWVLDRLADPRITD